ncbi:MAG: hypothetical protein CV089_19770 [Nitrospira sp. WS110]|nr:hypothetical protein [Nitrospira sp. WS110]
MTVFFIPYLQDRESTADYQNKPDPCQSLGSDMLSSTNFQNRAECGAVSEPENWTDLGILRILSDSAQVAH